MKTIIPLAVLAVIATTVVPICDRADAEPLTPSEIADVVSGLSSKDSTIRRQAAQLATQQPDIRMLGALQRALSDTDPVVRQRAAQAIRSIPDGRIDQTVIQCLKIPDVVVRREMIRRFEGRSTPQAVTAIERYLDDGDHAVRHHAAKILYENQHENATPVLLRAIEHKDVNVRVYAVARLEKVPPADALPPLTAHLNDDNDDGVRKRAIQVLRQMPDGAGDSVILEAFKHRDDAIRLSAVDHFANPDHQQRTPRAIDALAIALSDSHNSVRQRAAAALRASKDQRATALLLAAVKNADPEVRRQVVSRLHDLSNPQFIGPLIAACNDLDQPVRAMAMQALKRIEDPRAKAAAEEAKRRETRTDRNRLLADAKTPGQLRGLLSHRDNEVRRRAAETLRRVKGDEAAQMAIAALANSDPEVRRHMVERMREKPGAAFVPLLVKALNDTDQQTRQHAINALRATPGDVSMQACLAAFGHDDHFVRQRVVERFRDAPDARAVPLLVNALNDWDPHVRREAAQALRRTDDEQAMQASLASFEHFDVQVRDHVIFRFMEKPDAIAIPALMKVLSDGDSRNWNAAAHAVRMINDESATQAAFVLYDHADAGVRNHAVARFQELPDGRAVPLLAKALHDRDLNVCRQAAVSLRRTPGDDAIQAALAAFDHPDEHVRHNVVGRFVELPDARVTLQLIDKLDDEKGSVRRNAVAAIGRSATANEPEPLVPLLYHGDAQLRHIIAAKLKPIISAARGVAESPLSTGRTIQRMKSFPSTAIIAPTPFIEMIGGDRIVGEVIGGEPDAASSHGRTKVVLVQPLQLTVGSAAGSPEEKSAPARIDARWIRRIVWQPQGLRRYTPGIVFLRRGDQIRFSSVQCSQDGIAVLTSDGIKRVPFRDVAELHLPDRVPWVAYCEQLAVLRCKATDRIVRLDCADGSLITVGADQFTPFSNSTSAEPNEWMHGVHPAWSLDRLAARHRTLSVRSWLPATEVPLMLPRGEAPISAELLPWRMDQNVGGGRLESGARQYGWGFGVHADNVLRFPLPQFATGMRTKVGLDRIAEHRGCARGIVRIRVRDKLSELYRSPLIIGSKTVHDSGLLSFPPFDRAAHLELFADSAGGERPGGADPLNIRDFVDWLEPTLMLDESRLAAAIAEAAAQLKMVQGNKVGAPTTARLLPE